jgi:hypothetical protein
MRKMQFNLVKRCENEFDQFISNSKVKVLGIDYIKEDKEHNGFAIYQEVYKHKDFPGSCLICFSSYRPEWIEKWKS